MSSSHVSSFTSNADTYTSNPGFDRVVAAPLWPLTFVTQGSPLVLDVSDSINMTIHLITTEDDAPPSSAMRIFGQRTRTLSENDSGGVLFLAARTSYLSVVVQGIKPSLATVSVDSTKDTMMTTAFILIGGGATVLRNQSKHLLIFSRHAKKNQKRKMNLREFQLLFTPLGRAIHRNTAP
ncbi:Hypothetical protein, putative [Bodo saltans]|uniref:Uncharacterized protein n=1 Tax=Bodo saltans TaxID=75058 RepID=A0A0S4JWQ6_BODSA|nr:Hypothetical protein, putative [Bodo saltans]|eukprot:CUG93568.1 Hypothetical protein, putative [Bodo saltans]